MAVATKTKKAKFKPNFEGGEYLYVNKILDKYEVNVGVDNLLKGQKPKELGYFKITKAVEQVVEESPTIYDGFGLGSLKCSEVTDSGIGRSSRVGDKYSYDYSSTPLKVTSFDDFKTFEPLQHRFVNHRKTERIYTLNDKLTIVYDNIYFTKEFNVKYYKETISDKVSLTLNFKTGCFYIIVNNGNKRKVKKNAWKSLLNLLCTGGDEPYYKSSSFTDTGLIRFIDEILKNFNGTTYEDSEYRLTKPSTSCATIVLNWFIKHHKIKTTNNFTKTFFHYYPTIKELRKNDMNLNNTLLRLFELKGSVIKKYVNTHDNVDFYSLHFLLNLVGIDNIHKVNLSNSIGSVFDSPVTPKWSKIQIIKNDLKEQKKQIDDLNLSKSELNKFINILNNISFIEIKDHLRMRYKIYKKTDKWIKFSFRNHTEFIDEHNLLSNIIVKLEKDKITKIVNYDENLKSFIEQNIIIEDNQFHVKLLTNSDEYTEEGIFQSHCVGGYTEHYSSHIVSLRFGNQRCTIEYKSNFVQEESRIIEPSSDKYINTTPHTVTKPDRYTIGKQQNRMKFNKTPDGQWLEAIAILDERVFSFNKFISENDIYRGFRKKEIIKINRNDDLSSLFGALSLEAPADMREILPPEPNNNRILEPVYDIDYELQDIPF